MDLLKLFQHNVGSKVIQADHPVFREGDKGDFMFVLMEGRADILIGDEVVESARPGAIFGEMALVDKGPRSATVMARTACRVLPIDGGRFNALIQTKPDFARHVMKVMAERIRSMNERKTLKMEHHLKF